MSGYIQWPAEHKFKQGDLMLNGGLFWTVDGDGNFRILDDNDYLAICGGCGKPKQADILNVHLQLCEGRENHGESN